MPSGKAKEISVRVDGQLRHLRVDTNALCIVEELTGEDMLRGLGKLSLTVLRALTYGALVSGARATGGKRDFTPEDVGDWMELELGDGKKLVDHVLELLPRAMPEAKSADPQTVQEMTTTGPALAAS